MNLFHRINPWRPGRRKWALLALVLVLVLAGSPFYAWLYYRLGKVNHPDYGAKMLALVVQHLPPEGKDPNQPNAWEVFETVSEAVRQANLNLGGRDGDGTPDSDLPLLNLDASETTAWRRGEEFTLATPDQTLDALEHAGAFDAANRLRHSMRVVAPITSFALNQGVSGAGYLAHLSRPRTCALALLERARHQLASGDELGAVESLESVMALGRVMAFKPDLMAVIAGQAVQLLAIEGARELVATNRLSEDALRALLEAVHRQSVGPPVVVALEIGQMEANAMVAAFFDQFGPRPAVWLQPWVPIIIASEREMISAVDRVFEAARALAATAPCDRPTSGIDPERVADSFSRRLFIARIASTGFSTPKLLEIAETVTLQASATRLLVATELFERVSGNYPASLDDLVPSVLPEVPADPMAPDGKFRYTRIDAGPDSDAFTLYSVGGDCTDNGGRPSSECAQRPNLFVGEAGCDVVFWPIPAD